MKQKKETPNIENQARERYNLEMASQLLAKECIDELDECLNDENEGEMPDRLPQILEKQKKSIIPLNRKYLLIVAVLLSLLLMGAIIVQVYRIGRKDLPERSKLIAEENAQSFNYELTWLSEGFEYSDFIANGKISEVYYVHENGDLLRFSQLPLDHDLSIDNENHLEHIRLTNGNEAILIEKDGNISLFWRDDQYYLSLFGSLDKEIMTKIASSAIKTKNKEE